MPDQDGNHRGNFLAALLRRGAPMLATAPIDLADEPTDPAAAQGLARFRHLNRRGGRVERDGLLLRAARYIALVPLLYRVLAVPGAFAAFVAGGEQGLLPVLLVAVCSVGLNVFGVVWLLRSTVFNERRAARLLGLDVLFTVAAHLFVAATVPPAAFEAAFAVPGKHLLGGVALFTLLLGVLWGGALALTAFPLQLAGAWLNVGRFDPEAALGGLGQLAGVLLTATGALILLGMGTRLALAHGIRAGRQAERAVQHRRLHDTVLQTLEAMALQDDPEQLRRMAGAQAGELRTLLESAEGGSGRPLGEKLGALAAEVAREGLRAQVVVAELDDEALSEVRQLAVRDAVREALRNTRKHAHTDKVVVRVEERDGGLTTIVRDHGAGFSQESRPPGFGISESIKARLAEVGGSARVESAPGAGTRVTLWVPF
ncbi:Histidine kinase-, DNA gyrase B-, and HSP90-like ATPase [Amycolatopsis marina]|uniref:Histidine kinase-, DNA gyrase B-, and HSP90-like ATPase n=1 Tax=Amycolatopsis marina TaxID=490629 RepID=A0A1I0VYT7_9PSEU|nr:ATP-binding protein [Amycolatopsis marina]SFA80846.1 Histidine kinase-, DNA gyrase B-, and HSP90-like ATPase [Amycolatopsis marina]